MNTPPIELIDRPSALGELLRGLERRAPGELAVDFEAEFNLHRYGMHLCLIQLFDGSKAYLVDVVALGLRPELQRLFDNAWTVLMYGAQSDVVLLDYVAGMKIPRIYDVQNAAKLADYTKLGLRSVMSAELGVELPNDKHLQRANWFRRPLSPAMQAYAASDVLHLLELKKKLHQKVVEAGKLSDLEAMNRRVARARYVPKKHPHMQLKGAKRLTRRQRLLLRRLFDARDEAARELDLPPNSVISNRNLVEAAAAEVSRPEDLRGHREVLGRFRRDFEAAFELFQEDERRGWKYPPR